MTYIEFAKYFDPGLTNEQADFLIWNETAFPFNSLKDFTYQLRSAIRRGIKGIHGCELCGKLKCHCEEVMRKASEKTMEVER